MKKIVILGPESTGKSFLCKQLADYYQCQWVPEFARKYLETNGSAYRYEDLYNIALGQITSEDLALRSPHSPFTSQRSPSDIHHSPSPPGPPPSTLHRSPSTVFFDTDLYTIKIWSEISFNKCDNRILSQLAQRHYDLFLLCNTDLPWSPDPLREYPDLKMRQQIYHYYRDALINQDKPWVDISGNYAERSAKGREAVERFALKG